MALTPKIPKQHRSMQECAWCNQLLPADNFVPTKSVFYTSGLCPICNDCLRDYLVDKNFQWSYVDRLCQYLDIPFVPKEFERLHDINGDNVFPVYAAVFLQEEYDTLGWDEYHNVFLKLKEEKHIEDELPLLSEQKRAKLIERWGANYDDEALNYLEQLYQGLQTTQNIAGALQSDQAYKICKISLEIDSRIRAGQDFDKLLGSYDKLVKTAEFTPKNAKNASDVDSVGELIKWLEKKGWRCRYYDNVTRDIVDETIKNIQAYNQRLYINESGIGEEISNRIEALERAKKLEEANDLRDELYYGEQENVDLTSYENEGYNGLFSDNEFEAEVEGYDE